MSTLAGNCGSNSGGANAYNDGIGASSSFNTLDDVAVDSNGNVYVSDGGNYAIRMVTSTGSFFAWLVQCLSTILFIPNAHV